MSIDIVCNNNSNNPTYASYPQILFQPLDGEEAP